MEPLNHVSNVQGGTKLRFGPSQARLTRVSPYQGSPLRSDERLQTIWLLKNPFFYAFFWWGGQASIPFCMLLLYCQLWSLYFRFHTAY